ncbi:glutathione S-transferase 1-like isoform X2 [Diabrotica virgifera virgifera]|uniref:Glutathione S-transferase 1-like n=1 Tax=Diabrotica virgifera virgifera TaxID=50390 RepID=A0ABM5JXE6_DIAVI|nr:glutathione S-transferase 1-like isoform X2 [Diabrotica virgifera virgifera]
MAPKLYIAEVCPAVRSTLLLIKALGLNVELVPLNMAKDEHLTPEFLKINPLHTVPTLQDGDFVVCDSHAVNIYLIEKYHPETDLYPKCNQARATIHQRLFFDAGILFARMADIVKSVVREGAKMVSKDRADKVIEGYSFLEALLEMNKYVAGDHVTIADFSLVTTTASCNVVVPIASNRYPKISEWLANMEQLPYYKEAVQAGLDMFTGMMKSKLA